MKQVIFMIMVKNMKKMKRKRKVKKKMRRQKVLMRQDLLKLKKISNKKEKKRQRKKIKDALNIYSEVKDSSGSPTDQVSSLNGVRLQSMEILALEVHGFVL